VIQRRQHGIPRRRRLGAVLSLACVSLLGVAAGSWAEAAKKAAATKAEAEKKNTAALEAVKGQLS
jgi:hypothetical protein